MKTSVEKFVISDKLKSALYLIFSICTLVTIISYFHSPTRFWVNFIINNVYFVSMAICGLFLISLQNVTNSSWMRSYQRIPEAMMGYFPWAFVILLFSYFGMHTLYEWTHHELVKNDPILIKKVGYLNEAFFYIRHLIIFSGWITAAYFLKKNLDQWSAANLEVHSSKLARISAISIVFLALSFSFFSYDWIMSIEPHWFSTIYSVYVFCGMFVGGMAFITLAIVVLKYMGYFNEAVTENHLHDLGKWLFGMSTFWAYIWFCQYMLIWYSNIPEETQYYILRNHDNWQWIFWSNFIISFTIPFFGLLTRDSKRSPIVLFLVSGVILVGRWVDLYTLVAPKVYEHHKVLAIIGPYEIVSALMYAALFVFIFLKSLEKKSLLIESDPYLNEGIHLEQ